jgi:hypothetical protein
VSDAPRYVPYLRKQGRSYTAEMWEDPSGGWVRADLHDARIAELEAEVARLRDAYLRRVQIDEGCRLKDGAFTFKCARSITIYATILTLGASAEK